MYLCNLRDCIIETGTDDHWGFFKLWTSTIVLKKTFQIQIKILQKEKISVCGIKHATFTMFILINMLVGLSILQRRKK